MSSRVKVARFVKTVANTSSTLEKTHNSNVAVRSASVASVGSDISISASVELTFTVTISGIVDLHQK